MATYAGSPPPPVPYDFAVAQSTNYLIRARTLPNNTLEVVRAAAGASLTWSANLIAVSAGAGQGVALYVNGIDADVFAFTQDDRTIRHYRCADIEAVSPSWVTKTVYAVPAQPEASANRLAAPAANILFFTDSSSITGTSVYLTHYDSGAGTWDAAPTPWGLSNQKLLIERAYYFSATQNQSYHSTLAAINIGTDDYVLAFYADRPCDLFDAGLWTVRVSNAGTSSAIFQQPQRLFATTIPTNLKQSASNLTGAFMLGAIPKLCKVGNEYWIIATEYSQFANTPVQHCAYWRSADGVHWSDRQYLAGTDYIHTSGLAYFTGTELVFAQALVSGTNLYLFGYDRTWVASASYLTGADNTALKHDATAHTLSWTLSEPGAGQAATANTILSNGDHTYNTAATRALVRRGARLTRKAGYITPSGDELVTVSTELVDEVRQGVAIGSNGDLTNTIEVASRDYLRYLMDWTPDLYYEYNSGVQLNIGSDATAGFTDLTPVVVLNGTFSVANGWLYPGLLDVSSSYPDNLCIVNTGQLTHDGILEVRFSHNGVWATDGTDYLGVAFGVQDNQHYYAYLYNREPSPNDGKWYLYQATPPTSGTSVVTYTAIGTGVAAGYNVAPAGYWLRLQVYHNRVSLWSSPIERSGYVQLMSTTAVPPRAAYMGIISRGHLTAPTLQGPSTFTGAWDQGKWLNDDNPANLGKRMDYAVRIQAQTTGYLRGVAVLMDRSVVGSEYVPDMEVSVVNDNGTDHSTPADLSDSGNIIAATSVTVQELPIYGPSPRWTNIQFTTMPEVTAGTYYWVWVHANGDMPLCGVDLCGEPMLLHYNTSGSATYPALFSYNAAGGSNPNWYDFDDGAFTPSGSTVNLCLYESLNDSGTKFSGLFFASAETPKTLEYIATDIAAKSGIMSVVTDSQITDAFSSDSVGADGGDFNWSNQQIGTWSVSGGVLTGTGPSASSYGYRRSNSNRLTLNDSVIECDIRLLSATAKAGIIVHALDQPGAGLSGYSLVLDYALQSVFLCKITNTSTAILYRSPVLTPFPTGEWLHITVAMQAGYYLLYIDRALAGAFFHNLYTRTGYVGLCVNGGDTAGTVAQFDNFRIPDLGNIKPYFAVEARSSGKAALDRLFQKDRARYYARYDGALRLSRFRTRAVVDSYSYEISNSRRIDSDRYWFSHLQPEGNYFADRFSPTLLDSDGRRFKHEDYTDAQTDAQAYADAELPLRLAEELSVQYTAVMRANPCLEREDLVQVTNQEDGEANGQWIVNDRELTLTREAGAVTFESTLGLRKFVS